MVIPPKLSVFPHITQFTLDGGQIIAATLVSPAYSVTRIHTVASYTNQQHLQMTTGPALATLILGLDVQYANMSKKSVPDDSQSFAELSTSEKLDVFGVDQVAVKDPMALTSSIQDSLSFIMQGLNDSTWSEIGEARASLVSDCLFNRQSCNNDREITTIRNNVYGNCFSFNNNNETVTKYSVSSGMENGKSSTEIYLNPSDISYTATITKTQMKTNAEMCGIKIYSHVMTSELIVIVLALVIIPAQCQNGWLADSFGNCYYYVNVPDKWTNAMANCKSMQANLPQFCYTNGDYFDFVQQQMFFEPFGCIQDTWLGSKTGSTCTFDSFTKFFNTYPSTADCSVKKTYYCQIHANNRLSELIGISFGNVEFSDYQ
uniref:C-type lectin domain-containing protein n=1 Tax=Romanomermis culicivorax TaxID=13658 RepID=A0A915K133_ROMCU